MLSFTCKKTLPESVPAPRTGRGRYCLSSCLMMNVLESWCSCVNFNRKPSQTCNHRVLFSISDLRPLTPDPLRLSSTSRRQSTTFSYGDIWFGPHPSRLCWHNENKSQKQCRCCLVKTPTWHLHHHRQQASAVSSCTTSAPHLLIIYLLSPARSTGTQTVIHADRLTKGKDLKATASLNNECWTTELCGRTPAWSRLTPTGSAVLLRSRGNSYDISTPI